MSTYREFNSKLALEKSIVLKNNIINFLSNMYFLNLRLYDYIDDIVTYKFPYKYYKEFIDVHDKELEILNERNYYEKKWYNRGCG